MNYIVKTDDGKELSVKGELIVPGLALHQEKSGNWTIDHIPISKMLTEFQFYEQAKTCAKVISTIIRWDDENVRDLFVKTTDFSEYLMSIKKAVITKSPIPKLPEKLKYKLEFFRLQIQEGDFKRFCKAIDRLMEMSGLEKIKQEVMDMIYALAGQKKNEGIVKRAKANMHMVFYGPPGTGKTEVARIMSDILASLGYLSKGNLVEADRSTLVGKHIGQTAPQVKDIVKKAMGGTLFIDEAYSLANGSDKDFGNEAVSTLIKEMEDNKGKFVVILAGYQSDMNQLLDMNEGFRSRIKHYFNFYDYTPQQVSEITVSILVNNGYVVPEDSRKEIDKAISSISKQGKVEGNARAARNIAENIMEELNIRIGKDKEKKIYDTNHVIPQDVVLATDPKAKNNKRDELEEIKFNSLKKLRNLVGLPELKKQTERILNTLAMDEIRYKNGLISQKSRMHMVFYGPPGTGKTTVARIMGEFLKGAGLLSSGHFVEASRSDLVAGYVGQTAMKVKKTVSKAMGGILFIDEAYSLASGDDFGKEALDTLIKEMEDNGEDFVVILAGYKKDMEKLMNVNEGLKSRIPFHFDFPHYTPDELYQLAEIQLRHSYGLSLTENAKGHLKMYIQREAGKNGGYIKGDGRWIRNLSEEIKVNQSNRLSPIKADEITVEELKWITPEDLNFK